MKSVTNQTKDILDENNTPEKAKANITKYNFDSITNVHDAKIAMNALTKRFEALEIPMFVALYSGSEGYIYDAVLPEEIGKDSCSSEYGRFLKFLQVVIDFNKEDYIPIVKISE